MVEDGQAFFVLFRPDVTQVLLKGFGGLSLVRLPDDPWYNPFLEA